MIINQQLVNRFQLLIVASCSAVILYTFKPPHAVLHQILTLQDEVHKQKSAVLIFWKPVKSDEKRAETGNLPDFVKLREDSVMNTHRNNSPFLHVDPATTDKESFHHSLI